MSYKVYNISQYPAGFYCLKLNPILGPVLGRRGLNRNVGVVVSHIAALVLTRTVILRKGKMNAARPCTELQSMLFLWRRYTKQPSLTVLFLTCSLLLDILSSCFASSGIVGNWLPSMDGSLAEYSVFLVPAFLLPPSCEMLQL